MKIDTTKFNLANRWGNNDATNEICSAVKYIVHQMSKGWTAQEALEQTENQYGWNVCNQAKECFRRNFKKNNK